MGREQTRFRVEIPTILDSQLEAQVADLLGRAEVLRNSPAGTSDTRLSNAANRYEAEAQRLLETKAPAHFAMAHGSNAEIVVERITSNDGKVEGIKMSPIIPGNSGTRASLHAETVGCRFKKQLKNTLWSELRKLPVVLLRQKLNHSLAKKAGLLGALGNVLTHALGILGGRPLLFQLIRLKIRKRGWPNQYASNALPEGKCT